MPTAWLDHETQTTYRERYRAARPGWLAGGDQFDFVVQRWLGKDSAVLDLGCGRTGGIERFWRDVRLAVGIDPDRESLRDRKNELPVVLGGGDHLPFPDATFDMVVSVWVLEHLDAPDRVFAEVSRVMRPGGHFVFLTPNAMNPLILANRLGQLAPWLQRRLVSDIYGRAKGDTFAVRYRANSTRRLRGLAKRSGFSVMELRVIADPTYVAFNRAMFRAAIVAERLLPAGLGVHILGDLIRD
jgi:SAM-dependent methyltransferase